MFHSQFQRIQIFCVLELPGAKTHIQGWPAKNVVAPSREKHPPATKQAKKNIRRELMANLKKNLRISDRQRHVWKFPINGIP